MVTPAKCLFAAALAFCLTGMLPAVADEPDPSQPSSSGWRKFGESRPADETPYAPPQLVLPAGTWITIRVNDPLSSDRNHPGDSFNATLAQPLIVNGLVVARRGQTVEGRVAEATKAGRVKGTSRLGLELTEISLVDGQQLPVRTQLMQYAAGTSVGRDATAVATTTGIGAAIGAAADGGFGAGMGAIAGAAASAVGVLATRGRATQVYPEASLTFRTLERLTISTEQSAQAFQPVGQRDYEQKQLERRPVMRTAPRPPAYYGVYGYPYPYYYSPFYYGPSFVFYSGRGFHHGGGRFRR